MQKLTYEEYRGCKDILMIDLHNGYTIIAIKIWNKEKENYTVELRIKENTVDKWDLIDNKDAFVNALLLAFIVELFGLTIFNLFLFRII